MSLSLLLENSFLLFGLLSLLLSLLQLLTQSLCEIGLRELFLVDYLIIMAS